jgi:hypothetical protein
MTTSSDKSTLLNRIKELTAAQLLVQESADQFAFRHALTRQAAYASLLQRERKTLHRRTGKTIEQIYVDALAEKFTTRALEIMPLARRVSPRRAGKERFEKRRTLCSDTWLKRRTRLKSATA